MAIVKTITAGKKKIYFTLGGRGLKFDQGIKVASPWFAGRCKPSLKYKSKRR